MYIAVRKPKRMYSAVYLDIHVRRTVKYINLVTQKSRREGKNNYHNVQRLLMNRIPSNGLTDLKILLLVFMCI